MKKRHARGFILGLVLALAPCVQPPATAAVPPLTIEGLTASFDEDGVLIQPSVPLPGTWSWRYTLTTFGRAGLQVPAPPPVLIADAEKRVLVRPGLREVYEVKETIKGFEQTFIIEEPPPGVGSILLEGFVTTDLEPEGGIRLPNRVAYLLDGLPQLQYANLAVSDVTGRALAARMDWTEDGRTISLWINEEGQYPIRVDPGIGGCPSCEQADPGTQCWCAAVNLCAGGASSDCVDPMHAALSPLKINGTVGGAAFFYRAMEPGDQQDQNNMIMLEGSNGSSVSAVMEWATPEQEFPHLACSGHSFLRDGRLFIAGGNFDEGLAPNHAYIWRDDDISPENALRAAADPSEMCGQPADLDQDCLATPDDNYTGNRWYPTTHPLWDGRIMLIGGQALRGDPEDPEDDIWNNSYEFYRHTGGSPPGEFECSNDFRIKDSAGDNICAFSKTCQFCWDYPRYHAIQEGLLFAGPVHDTYLFSYTHLENDGLLRASGGPFGHQEETSRHDGGWVTLEVDFTNTSHNQQRRVLLVGGFGVPGEPGPPTVYPQHLDTAEVFDAQATPSPDWRWTCTGTNPCTQTKMQRARQYAKTVLLPNRMVLIVGGEKNNGDGENSSEIFDPSDETFVEESLLEGVEDGLDKSRRYHSEAFLLPDGRVITAGDDTAGEGIVPDEDGATYNVYYPAYMSQARPTILASPAPPTTIQWNQDFTLCVSGFAQQSDFHSVILVRPSSTTHSIDFDHRQVQLAADYDGDSCGSGGKEIFVDMPAYPGEVGDWRKHVLPPGYYMLIVRKSNGEDPPIPSVAKFVEFLCYDDVCEEE
jgi:hypothetical protein